MYFLFKNIELKIFINFSFKVQHGRYCFVQVLHLKLLSAPVYCFWLFSIYGRVRAEPMSLLEIQRRRFVKLCRICMLMCLWWGTYFIVIFLSININLLVLLEMLVGDSNPFLATEQTLYLRLYFIVVCMILAAHITHKKIKAW